MSELDCQVMMFERLHPITAHTLNRPKVYLTTTTQQNEEKKRVIVIYDLIIVILQSFRIF